jgi:galactoside O-acetyltransferase
VVQARLRSLRALRRDARFRWKVGRALAPPPPDAFASFGAGSWIVPPARVSEPGHIEVGDRVVILEHAWLSVVSAHEGITPRLVIGNRVRLGRGASIACVGEVVLEDDVMASDNVFVADCYHQYEDPFVPVLRQPMSRPAPVVVERGAYLGAGSIVLPGVRVGAGAYVGEGAVVTHDVPPRAVVFGNPARIVREVPA